MKNPSHQIRILVGILKIISNSVVTLLCYFQHGLELVQFTAFRIIPIILMQEARNVLPSKSSRGQVELSRM